jgi:hypothetical protein
MEELVYYLVRAQSDRSLLSILTDRTNNGVVFAPNAWRQYRQTHTHDERFKIDVSNIYSHFASQPALRTFVFEGLSRSALAKISLFETSKGIDVRLCVALIKSGLWSDGVGVSHAKRRFAPREIAAVAQAIQEPLRTNTINDAVAIALADANNAKAASDMVHFALIYEGEQKQRITYAAISFLERHLQRVREWVDIRYYRFEETPTELLRAALRLWTHAAAASHGLWRPDLYVERFITGANLWKPDPELFKDSSYVKSEYSVVIAGLETLLFLSHRGPDRLRNQAISVLATIYNAIRDRRDYAAISFKIALLLELEKNRDRLREKALASLATPYARLFSSTELFHNLWEFEGISGLAILVANEFGDDEGFHNLLMSSTETNPCKTEYLEAYLARRSLNEQNEQFATTLPGALG